MYVICVFEYAVKFCNNENCFGRALVRVINGSQLVFKVQIRDPRFFFGVWPVLRDWTYRLQPL